MTAARALRQRQQAAPFAGKNRRGSVAALLLAAACALCAPSAFAATLYGLIDTGELYSSADNGVSWSPLSTLPVSMATRIALKVSTDRASASQPSRSATRRS